MDVFLSHPHHPDHAFWASGQLPMIGPSAQPNQRLTREQWQLLEHHFSQDKKPTTVVKRGIAQSMNVPLEKINNWFQNRRAKARQEQKKAEAAARDGRPLPDSLNAHITVGEQQTLQLRPASQPIGPAHPASSLTPPQQPMSETSSSHGQSTLPSPSEELGCGIPSSMATSLSGDASFDHSSFVTLANSAASGLPMTVLSTESIHSTSVYPSPEPTVFSSPEQQFQVASQSVSASASQSPEGLHPTILHDFSDAAGAENVISSGPGLQHNPYLSSDPSVPDITFPNAHSDSVLTSALTFADCPPFIDGFSLPSTPTFSDGQFAEIYNCISTQAAPPVISAPCEIASQNSSYLELPCSHDMINTGGVSLSTAPERQSPDQVMPPPDSLKLFKPRQSSQPSLASRRRKNVPGAIVVNPISSIGGRSGSYTAGMAHPLSPRSPLLTAPDQSLRRIKSSNNTAGRIQKPMTPAQRSPLVFAFAHNSHLLENQTPPPSASVVDTPTACNATYPTLQSMFAPEINYHVPWSAPPTQHEFMFPPDFGAFPGPGFLHSTPSPTSRPQHLAS